MLSHDLFKILYILFTYIDHEIQAKSMISVLHSTMGQNREKHRINSYLIICFPISEGVSEVSEQANE